MTDSDGIIPDAPRSESSLQYYFYDLNENEGLPYLDRTLKHIA